MSRNYRNIKGIPFFSTFLSIVAGFCLAAPALATNPPVISPATGVYSSVQATATITGDAGATFNFTTDGSTPTLASPTYSSPITLANTNTIKAIATVGGVSSSVTTAYIQSDPSTVPVTRTNLVLWLKPEFMNISAGKVTQWSDLSGASPANNATQGTSTNQPSQVTNSLFGYPGVSFNGTNSYLILPSFMTNLTNGFSIFAVINPNTSSTAKTLMTASSSGINDMTSVQINSSTVTYNANAGGTPGSAATLTGAVATAKYQILDVVHSGAATATIYVNSVDKTNSSAVQNLANIARPVAYIGADNAKLSTAFWGGKIAEMLIYSRAVSVTERANIEAYLANRFQVTTATSTPAPIFSVAAGTLAAPTYVAISAPANATTFFTLDGTTPTTSSPQYLGPVYIPWTETLKAISVANGITSATTTAAYTLGAKYPAPNATDTTSLQINLQLPTTAIPQ